MRATVSTRKRCLFRATQPFDFADPRVTLFSKRRANDSRESMRYRVRPSPSHLRIVTMPEPERIDPRRTALIAYDVCRRALTPPDPARAAAMRPVLDAWVRMIAVARAA